VYAPLRGGSSVQKVSIRNLAKTLRYFISKFGREVRVSSIYKPTVVGLNAPFRATPGKLKTGRSFSGRIRC